MVTAGTKRASAKRKSAVSVEPTVIYVHGIGAKPPKPELKREWDLALFGREMGAVTRMAYWADILHGEEPQVTAQGTGGESIDIDAILSKARLSANDSEVQELVAGLLRGAGILTAPGLRSKVLPLPAFLRKPIARVFLQALIMDTATYFFRKGVRKAVQERLRAQLPTTDNPVVLVAHSQGTVIALEVLAALRADTKLRVEHFITIGSPLGVREVQDFLACPLEVPQPVIGSWTNFSDPLDIVALDKAICGDFVPDRFIVDEVIMNTRTRLTDGFNPHSAAGYLAHPKVRSVVTTAARIDVHARFLVARDVGAALAIEARHPVLIEMLEVGYPAVGETRAQTEAFERDIEGGAPTLASRIAEGTAAIARVVGNNEGAAKIDPLKRYIAAHLTPAELSAVAAQHRDMRIYAIWKSTRKRKLLERSCRVVQADAARTTYRALGAGVTWAVLDTGVRADHPHFATHRTILNVWDCTQPGPPKAIASHRDRDGHGTHVSGIVAGQNPNGSEMGIAPLTKLVVYKVLNDRGEGEDAWIIKALDHIAERNDNSADLHVHGLNLSLGGPYDATVYGCGFTPICMELRRLWRSGVLVCVASGNEGQTQITTPGGEVDLNSPMSIGDPANLEECIAVGSVNADRPHLYGVSSFSSRGPTSDGRVKPDVVAPGERIRSCDSRFRTGQSTDLYRVDSGTSMAAPHVSGMLAAFLSVRREFQGRPDEVKNLLLRTCTDIGRDRYHQGHGVPNLMRMLLEA